MITHFDAVIVGAGQGGPSLAQHYAQSGQTVAVIERGHVGGACVNVGCTPTKAWAASAHAAHRARSAMQLGVRIAGDVSVDMGAVKARKDGIVAAARTSVEQAITSLPNCRLIRGHARFVGPKLLSVNGERIAADNIFVNVGARAMIPKIEGLEETSFLTSSSILELDSVPPHLLILGGSYIGLEFAQMFRRFGSEVTLIERSPRLLPHEDDDVSAAILDIMLAEGIRVLTATSCVRLSRRRAEISAVLEGGAATSHITGSHLLLAVGRQPNTADLGLEETRIATDANGYIKVDDFLRTNEASVWAIGECNGRSAFTHTAYNDAHIVAANIFGGASRSIRGRTPCYGLFIDPALGRAGMSEKEALDSGRTVRIGRRPMSRVGRAVEQGETRGFMKIIVDAHTDKILGGTVLGLNGDEAIHCIIDAINSELPYTVLRDTMHIHPTISELIPTLLAELSPPTARVQ